jgi:hypothetical protein
MNEIKAILATVAGCAMIFFGFTLKQFYAAKGLYGAGLGHPVARWKGRLLFVAVGAGFLLIGFKYLFFDVYR